MSDGLFSHFYIYSSIKNQVYSRKHIKHTHIHEPYFIQEGSTDNRMVFFHKIISAYRQYSDSHITYITRTFEPKKKKKSLKNKQFVPCKSVTTANLTDFCQMTSVSTLQIQRILMFGSRFKIFLHQIFFVWVEKFMGQYNF